MVFLLDIYSFLRIPAIEVQSCKWGGLLHQLHHVSHVQSQLMGLSLHLQVVFRRKESRLFDMYRLYRL